MRFSRTRRYMLLKNAAKRVLPGNFAWSGPVDDEATCAKFLVPPVLMDWPDEVPKPRVGLVADGDAYPYWTKFRRFLRADDIPFRPYDIHRSD